MSKRRVLEDDGPPDRLMRRYIRLGPVVSAGVGFLIAPRWAGPTMAGCLLIATCAAVTYGCWHLGGRRTGDRAAFVFSLAWANVLWLVAFVVGNLSRFLVFDDASRPSLGLAVAGLLAGVPASLLWMPVADALLAGRREFIQPNQCQKCGYDLTGNVAGRCPECGTPTPAASG